ncbi:tripartite tricarboxylate transporter TctB family protein [Agrobacterium tumefaciens]|uniref:tripartite tricarboxylate transporter TctB family protein n=1 Tax=Agrobacterium tumefaciens TaxID=358 RepID=UPI0012B9AF4F|nr:tripartite tricarboxylate transporter TctB family protein [Agrobacterium tumefaciens]MQB07252.1 tripartite tricarboxylate transporter TctB family protein [Agrobacterium tumefaciens]
MNTKSIISGGVCILIGSFFGLSALTSLKIGTSTNMGPGYFPLSLAIILIAIGAYIALKALKERSDGFRFDLTAVPWRGTLLICVSPLILGLTIRGMGLAPAIFLTAIVSAFASRAQTIKMAVLVSVALTIFCVLIFGVILKLPIPIVGPWLSL